MTATTADAPALARRSARPGPRFALAFLAGLAAVLALGAGGLYAWDRQFEGRILPGVTVAGVDLSGLGPEEAAQRLETSLAGMTDGSLVLTAGDREVVVPWESLGRRVEVDALVQEAMAVGRAGGPVERIIGEARTAIRGADLAPRVAFDAEAVAARVEAAAAELDAEPRDASVTVGDGGFTLVEGANGAVADREAPLREALAVLGRTDAPDRLAIEIPVRAVEPNITTREAAAGMAAAEAIARDVDIAIGEERWTIAGETIRSWLRISPTVDSRYVPVLDVTNLPAALEPIAEEAKVEPRSASFRIDGDAVVGVVAGQTGRRLHVGETAKLLADALRARGGGTEVAAVEASTRTLQPALTTEAAEAAAPKMERISTWQTYFAIGEKNGFGANIWIPAEDIDGYVVAPGDSFDFWEAIGPITRERGYRDGGAIINGRTEPTGALAGGICSTSTTLFNAVLRAGFEIVDRRNHYYYIDRYPLGLDATVFKSSSGAVQTMSWRNDTEYPVLIRGYRIQEGSDGYVRFDLYSVPNQRTVSISEPRVENVLPASDSIEYTSALPAGQRKRIESPTDGKEVWVSRVVRDASGNVIHEETFYSNYARITGVVQVGTG